MIKRIFLGLLLVLVALATMLVLNTLRQGSRQLAVPALAPMVVDSAAVAASLAEALRARTVSGLLDATGTAACRHICGNATRWCIRACSAR